LRGAGAAGRLNELMLEQPDIAPPARPIALPSPPRGALAFQQVSFRYPSRPDSPALVDFSLTIEPGETVAIVGPSGAGKSTLFLLAQRFYDPQAGMVRIDGVPLPQADPAEIRARMALVPQEAVLFAASARDNLRYGAWEASDEAIWAAARAANAEDFLRALPEGSTRSWAKAARACRAGNASAWRSPAPCCAMRRSSSSTRPPARSTRKASGWCRMRSTA
jgi:ATP-binding cassette subfamily B protein